MLTSLLTPSVDLLQVVRQGGVEAVRDALVSAGAAVKARTPGDEDSALTLAIGSRASGASDDTFEIVRMLVDAAPDLVNARTSKYNRGVTPLHLAAAVRGARQVDIVRLLLDKGANVNAKSVRKETPLHIACTQRVPIDVIKELLDKGANPTAKLAWDDRTVLHIAAQQPDPAVIDLLLTKVNNANMVAGPAGTPADCETPLHIAAAYGHVEVVQRLLDSNKQAVDKVQCHLGATPLMNLCMASSVSPASAAGTAAALLAAGADIKATTTDKRTALHLAAQSGNVTLVEVLLDAGADPLAEAEEPGSTPIKLAATPEVSRVFASRGLMSPVAAPIPPQAPAPATPALNVAAPVAPAAPPLTPFQLLDGAGRPKTKKPSSAAPKKEPARASARKSTTKK